MFKKLSDIFNDSNYKKSNFKSYKSNSSYPDVIDFHMLVNDWEEIVGAKLAANTVPLKNQNKTLTILTNHPAYAQQLSFMENVLKEKIFKKHSAFKAHIKKILFKTSTEYFDSKKEELVSSAKYHSSKTESKADFKGKLHPQNPEYRKLQKKYEEEFSFLEDDEARQKLISMAIQKELLK